MTEIEDINKINFEDKYLQCCDCGNEFLFCIGEQRYFLSRSLSTPRRCPICRKLRKSKLVPDPQFRGV